MLGLSGEVKDVELSLYDTQPGSTWGVCRVFTSSNLLPTALFSFFLGYNSREVK